MSLTQKDLEAIRGIVKEELVEVNERLDRVEQRLEKVELRLDNLEQRMEKVEQRLDRVEQRLDMIVQRLEKVEQRLDNIEERLTNLETVVYKLDKRVWSLEIAVLNNRETLSLQGQMVQKNTLDIMNANLALHKHHHEEQGEVSLLQDLDDSEYIRSLSREDES